MIPLAIIVQLLFCYAVFFSNLNRTSTLAYNSKSSPSENLQSDWLTDNSSLDTSCTDLSPPHILSSEFSNAVLVIRWSIKQSAECYPEEINVTCSNVIAERPNNVITLFRIINESEEEELITTITDLDANVTYYKCYGKLRVGFMESEPSAVMTVGNHRSKESRLIALKDVDTDVSQDFFLGVTPLLYYRSTSNQSTDTTSDSTTTSTPDGEGTSDTTSESTWSVTASYPTENNSSIIVDSTTMSNSFITNTIPSDATEEGSTFTTDETTEYSTITDNSTFSTPTEINVSSTTISVSTTTEVILQTTTQNPVPHIDLQLISSGANYIQIQWTLLTSASYPESPIFQISIELVKVKWDYDEKNCDFYLLRNVTTTMTTYNFTNLIPYSEYKIEVKTTNNNITNGDTTIYESMQAETAAGVPSNVRHLRAIVNSSFIEEDYYNVSFTITYERQCYMNGSFQMYQLLINSNNGNNMFIRNTTNNTFTFSALPDTNYTIKVMTIISGASSISKPVSCHSPAGIPKSAATSNQLEMHENEASSIAKVVLRKSSFQGDENGKMMYISLIVSNKNISGGEYQKWNYTEPWPIVASDETSFFYEVTPSYWNPFDGDIDVVEYDLTDGKCGNQLCERAFENGKTYYLILRMFNSNFYRNSIPMAFEIKVEEMQLGLIIGIVCSSLICCVICVIVLLFWKRKLLGLNRFYQRKQSIRPLAQPATCIHFSKFPRYVQLLENNPHKFQEQFALLAEKTKEVIAEHTTSFAVLAENRRKNRYINILPFDDSRVKLQLDEDDEIASDYINASYIKGFIGNMEYIATQGPLPSTCRDFWKMILQEQVKLIVMVSQFAENSKSKVHRYFPKNQESMQIGNDITVKCLSKMHFGAYCIRSLQVEKDSRHEICTHLQYLHWPDFGVPDDTQSMLQFCYQIRERFKYEGGPIVVHCSAGVGRTGTIIATDILLQRANAKKDIDVFNTVLDLRRQRINMVQTEMQYMYIHTLIKDYIDVPPTAVLVENIPIYENLPYVDKMESTESNHETEF